MLLICRALCHADSADAAAAMPRQLPMRRYAIDYATPPPAMPRADVDALSRAMMSPRRCARAPLMPFTPPMLMPLPRL